MNIAFALDYLPRRMKELGYGENYATRYLNFRVGASATKILRAYNQLVLLIEPQEGIRMVSSRGIFEKEDVTIDFQQHEHSGKISIENKSDSDVQVILIQVIPLNTKKKNSHA